MSDTTEYLQVLLEENGVCAFSLSSAFESYFDDEINMRELMQLLLDQIERERCAECGTFTVKNGDYCEACGDAQ